MDGKVVEMNGYLKLFADLAREVVDSRQITDEQLRKKEEEWTAAALDLHEYLHDRAAANAAFLRQVN